MEDKIKMSLDEFASKVEKLRQEVALVQKACRKRLLLGTDIDRFVNKILEMRCGKALMRSEAVPRVYGKRYCLPTTTVVRWKNGEFDVKRILFMVENGDHGCELYYQEGVLEIDYDGLDYELARKELGLV